MPRHRVQHRVQWPAPPLPETRKQVQCRRHPSSRVLTRPSLLSTASEGLAGIFRQVRGIPSDGLRSRRHSFLISYGSVRAPRRALRLVFVPHGRHRDVHPLRVFHRQLCRLRPCNFFYIHSVAKPFMHAARSQTVIVVVLLAMDFWNCRVRLPLCETRPICAHPSPYSERRWADSCRSTFLESGLHPSRSHV